MEKINLSVPVPKILANLVLWFVLRYRKKRFGFAFRRIRLIANENVDEKYRPVWQRPVAALYAIVDPDDYQKLEKYCWHFYESPKNSHSAVRYCNSRIMYMHRVIMNAPTGSIVDHKNRNSLDNRRANLRFTTPSQNACNRKQKNGSSKYKGVYYNKEERKWRANITYKGRRKHLGYFDNEEDAARTYDAAAKIYHGEFAVLNFNDEPPAEPGAK